MANTNDASSCQCENGNCYHGEKPCVKNGARWLLTIYGEYWMCHGCADAMPSEYLKGDPRNLVTG